MFYGYFLASVIAVFFAANKGEAAYGVFRIITMIAFLYAASVTLEYPHTLIKSMIILGIILGVYSLYQYGSIYYPSRRIGTMGNMNLCSSAHLLLTAFSVYALFEYQKTWKILSVISIIISLFVIFYSLRTRTVWLSFFVTSAVLSIYKKKYLVIALAVTVLIAGIYLKGKSAFDTASMRHRFQSWNQTLHMVKDNPLGVGYNSWQIEMPTYCKFMSSEIREFDYRKRQTVRPHNDYLQVLAETGIIGFMFYIGIFASAMYYAVKSKNVLSITGITAYMVIAFFSFPGERTFHTIVLLIFIAMALPRKEIEIKRKRVLYLLSIIAICCLLFATYIYSVRLKADNEVLYAQIAQKENRYKDVLEIINDRSSVFASLEHGGIPYMYFRGIALYKLGYPKLALRTFERAAKYNPHHIKVITGLGYMYKENEEYSRAMKCYNYALYLFPGDEHSLSNMREILWLQN
jgi:O-antigen ligase